MTAVLFDQAVDSLLRNWAALQLAVQHGAGGENSVAKGQWLPGAIVQYFMENSSLEVYDIEDFLTDFLNEEMDTCAEDGSVLEISNKLVNFYKMFKTNDSESLQKAINQITKFDSTANQECSTSSKPSVKPGDKTNNTDESDSSEEMETEDAEGWQTVSRSRTKHRK